MDDKITIKEAYAEQILWLRAKDGDEVQLARLDQFDAHPALRHAIHMATELEDVADLIPDKLASAIADVEAELLKALAETSPHEDPAYPTKKSELHPVERTMSVGRA
jgi:hypothetical protein